MNIIVCGGRKFKNYSLLHDTLLPFLDFDTKIIEGGAKGADRMARDFANHYGVFLQTFPADWKRYGKSAGMIRNRQMLNEGRPDLVVAFPGGKGTANMVDLAKRAGVEVLEIDSKNPSD